MKIASAAYPIDWYNRWNDFVGKLRVWVRKAAEQEAELLVFPEYGVLDIASLADEQNAGNTARAIDAVTARIGDVDDLHASLASEFGVHICAGTAPLRTGEGRSVNRARLFTPDGGRGAQDKLVLTPFEREEMGLVAGEGVRVFDTALGRIGILICYDAEFPLIARAMVEAEAEILLVPSCTDTAHGYARVRIAAMARALESQCVVVHSVIIGDADWLAAANENVGAAAIYGPPDGEFPEDGLIAAGKMNEPGWVYGEVSLQAVRDVRNAGRVRNVAHWPEQDARVARAEVVALGAERGTAGAA